MSHQPLKPKKPVGRPEIWTQEKLADEAKEMLEWASQEDSLVLAEFYGKRGYDYDDVHDFEKKSLEFSKAKKIAKIIIGARRERGALKGKLDSAIVRKSMALYDPEMKAYELEMKNASKHELTETLGETVINAVREIEASRTGNDQISRSIMETQQSVLDKGLSGQAHKVLNELGTERAS